MNTQTLANDVEQNSDSYPMSDLLTTYLGYNTARGTPATPVLRRPITPAPATSGTTSATSPELVGVARTGRLQVPDPGCVALDHEVTLRLGHALEELVDHGERLRPRRHRVRVVARPQQVLARRARGAGAARDRARR